MVLDKLALDNNFSFREESKLKCFLAKSNDVMYIKPTTFMNLSGEAVRAVMDYYKIDVKDILIVYDDIALDLGRLRFRANGSDGGHNGIKSIISELGTEEFARIRIGIGKPEEKYDKINYVIGQIPEEENKLLQEGVEKAKDAVIEILKNGIDKAMNKFN